MLKRARYIVISFWILICPCFAVDVVLLYGPNERPNAFGHLELACAFYGLNLKSLFVGEHENKRQFLDIIKQEDVQAMVVTWKAIETLNAKLFIPALKRRDGKSIPMMIIEVNPEANSKLLSEWSGGIITGCTSFYNVSFTGFYKVSDMKIIARQLAGQKIPFNCNKLNYFICSKMQSVQSIIHVSNSTNENLFPIFIKTMVDGQEVFFITKNQLTKLSLGGSSRDDDYILQILPIIMFLRYACGQRCWNSPGHYGNLTIDDLWLTEPYGHLSYKELLEEMENHNFHTTIAFIPWNYDRSEPDVVSLFRDNPDRFSVCIHGNNHDHQEFYKYTKILSDSWSAKSLSVQEANIQQSLARMAKFQNLAGLSYDKVMVFPHGIAPARTLGLLKKYNFMATVNAGNVPLDSHEPADSLFWLRPVTMKFENFPSLKRYLPKKTQSNIAID